MGLHFNRHHHSDRQIPDRCVLRARGGSAPISSVARRAAGRGMAMTQLFPMHYRRRHRGRSFLSPAGYFLERDVGPGADHFRVSKGHEMGTPSTRRDSRSAIRIYSTNAILAACDALDGLVDGVIDNRAACHFDPATFIFPSSGPYGSIAPGQRLQCTGAKTATVSSDPRASDRSEDDCTGSENLEEASRSFHRTGHYCLDIPSTAASCSLPASRHATLEQRPLPRYIGLGSGQLPLFWLDYSRSETTTRSRSITIRILVLSPPTRRQSSNSTDISRFVDRGGKLIFYHGLSESSGWTVAVHRRITSIRWRSVSEASILGSHTRPRGEGGNSDDRLGQAEDFMKLYLVPNMGHCGGNASTANRSNMLTPMVNWD